MTKRPTLAGLHILVVEDDRDLAGLIATGLTDEECKVTLAYDGGAGLLQAERHSFDLILLDVMLPVIETPAFTEGTDADPSSYFPRRTKRCCRGSRCGCRRLPGQALRI